MFFGIKELDLFNIIKKSHVTERRESMKRIILLVLLMSGYNFAMKSHVTTQDVDLPGYCNRHGIVMPQNFWRFWADFYTNPHKQESLRASPSYQPFHALMWTIYNGAKAEAGSEQAIDMNNKR